MRKLQLHLLGIATVFLLLFQSCIPDIKIDEDADAWNPDFGIPLLSATFDMEDVLENVEAQQSIELGPDSLLIATYSERVSVTAPPDIPDIPTIIIPVLDFNQNAPNPTSGFYRLDVIDAKEGILTYKIDNPHLEEVEVSIRFMDIRQNGTALEWNFILPPAISSTEPSSQEGTLDLNTYQIDLRNGFRTEYTASLVNSGTDVPIHPFLIEMSDLDFSYIQGYLGQFEIEVPGDSINFGFLETWDQGSLEFVSSELRLNFHSTYGVPVTVTTNELNFQTFLNGEVSLSNPALDNGISMDFPTINEVGETRSTELVLNNTNSNIASVISGIPYQLDYDLLPLANPNEDTTIINHLTDNVRLDVDIEVDIPLYGSARDFTFNSEYEADFDDLKDVERAGFKVYADNGFPIDVGLQIYFLADDGSKIDSLYLNEMMPLIPSADINAAGVVTQSTVTESFTYLEEERFAAIKASTKKIELVASASTPDNGSIPVRIYSYYNLIVKLGFQAGL